MSDGRPQLSTPYAIFSLSIVVFFFGVLIGGSRAIPESMSLTFGGIALAWLIGIGIYNIGKLVERND